MTVLAQGDNSQLNRIESRNIPLHFIFKVPKALNVKYSLQHGTAITGRTHTKQ